MCGAHTLHYTYKGSTCANNTVSVTGLGVFNAHTSTSEPVASATQCSKKSMGNFTTSPLGPEDE